ncbi:MAG: DUF6386 family protein [Planctomycetota bacterium]
MTLIPISTDLAAVAVFDPEVLAHRVRDRADWWRIGPLAELPELRNGQITIVQTGKEGPFRLVAREGEPTDAELELITGEVGGLGVEVRSGQLFVGASERLPGDGRGERLSYIPDTGVLLDLAPGRYSLTIHALHWRHLDAYYDDDNEVREDAPPDLLILWGPQGALDFPEPLPTWKDLLPRAEAKGSTHVPKGTVRRRSSSSSSDAPRRRRGGGGGRSEPERTEPLPPPARITTRVAEERAPLSSARVRSAFLEVLDAALRHPEPKSPWRTVVFQPRERHLLGHDVSKADLHKKTTRVREQLRVLEAKLNANDALTLAEKVELQASVTGVYRSLDGLLGEAARLINEGKQG